MTALVPAMAAYNGFSVLGEVGGEIVNPRKNLPRAGISGVLVVVSLYLLINWVIFISSDSLESHIPSTLLPMRCSFS